ncbi:MAG: hypothetical protein E7335_04680 [Clostridiales bacterium]|nr:hypothetical protein [Clostridiales bacterium]
MKRLQRCIRAISILVLCAFVFTASWFGWTVQKQSGRWIATSYNTRLSAARKNTLIGNIYDREGMTLASTDSEGNRVYNDDSRTRRAVSQTVGDTLSMSGTGVETFHAATLLGLSRGSLLDTVMNPSASTQGNSIRLTISAELCRYINKQFPEGYNGAVSIINYKTGEILGMVSMPYYDPEKVLNRSEDADASGSGYLNRNTQGQYAPGSIFKIVTLASVLEYLPGAQYASYECNGIWTYEGGQVTCAGNKAHGTMTLEEAFAQSCNVTFAKLAYELGAERLASTAKAFGFNDTFRFQDLILYDSSMDTRMPTIGDLAWTGVGQGKTLVSPLHMAMIAGTVANGGIMASPKLIADVITPSGNKALRVPDSPYGRAMQAGASDIIGGYMRTTVKNGTAHNADISGYTVCGKTGSAQVADNSDIETNAWFTGFVYDNEHPYAIAVVIEEGGSGSNLATRLAKKVLEKAIELGL